MPVILASGARQVGWVRPPSATVPFFLPFFLSFFLPTMTQIHRAPPPPLPLSSSPQARSVGGRSRTIIFVILFTLVLYLALNNRGSSSSSSSNATTNGGGAGNSANDPSGSSSNHAFYFSPLGHNNVSSVGQEWRLAVARKREQLHQALRHLSSSSANLPPRLAALRAKHEIVGERLSDIQSGTETVFEILHGVHAAAKDSGQSLSISDKPPMELNEIIEYLDQWIHTLHETLLQHKHSTFEQIWQAYHDLTVKTLFPWDQDYLSRMPPRREDGSTFLSLATYRDENCFNTVHQAYLKAKYPEKLFIGLVQQNCHKDCKSGVLANLSMVAVPPDDDCYQLFCETDIGKSGICERGQIRVLNIDEPESLGPYAARYFASKLWYGEQWFMQTDAHMTFATHWDAISIEMLQKAPSKKPILSHYPPSHTINLDLRSKAPASRLCGPVFATSDLEAQIIRLEGAGMFDNQQLEYPGFAPFTAAGYFVAHSEFLREVPFDPFLPWIFMGEEIIMSSRLWTAGYDIFSPSQSVVGHMYVRRHKPKFWESVHRAFTAGVHNPLQAMVLDRVKYQLGYPESAKDMLRAKSLLTAIELYTMGKARPLSDYLKIVGLNMTTKEVTYTAWCETGTPPPGFEQYNHLYPNSKHRAVQQ